MPPGAEYIVEDEGHTGSEPVILHVGLELFVTVTSSNALQVPFVTVQRTIALVPTATPVTVVIGELGVVIVADPEIKLHTPEPTDGVLCVIVKLPLAHCA